MAEGKIETREVSWRQLLPWTELFRGFHIALDLNKLLLAAAGIFVMALGWSLLAVLFSAGSKEPTWVGNYEANYPPTETAPDRPWTEFKRDRDHWNIMHEATGVGGSNLWKVEDLAESKAEYERVKAIANTDREDIPAVVARLVREEKLTEARAQVYRKHLRVEKRAGTLSTWPWFENRGPNPYLLVTGQAGVPWTAAMRVMAPPNRDQVARVQRRTRRK